MTPRSLPTVSPAHAATANLVRRVLAVVLLLAGLAALQVVAPAAGPAAADESAPEACPAVATADGSTWDCTFSDEFEGEALDRDKWLVQQTKISGFFSGLTCFSDSERNVRVEDGELKLIVQKEPEDYNCTSFGGWESDYTGGGIITRPELAQTYGRFEVRAKFPETREAGTHGAFWMYPSNLTYGAWPLSGEIDVAEWWSSDPTLVMPTLHYLGEKVWVDNGYNCRVSTPSDYHTYTVEWLPTGFKFFIDGDLCWERIPEPLAPLLWPKPFDHPFSIVLSMGVGPASGTNAVTDQTVFPSTFTVDYARMYKKNETSDPEPTPTPTPEPTPTPTPTPEPTPSPTPTPEPTPSPSPSPTPSPEPSPSPSPSPSPEPDVVKCAGKVATIVGDARNNTITGTTGDDVIHGLGGSDAIDGLGGNDIICGGDGHDRLVGGSGDDGLYGDAGNDSLLGDAGKDELYGGRDIDMFNGGADHDRAFYTDHDPGVTVTINNKADDGDSTDGSPNARDNVTTTVEAVVLPD